MAKPGLVMNIDLKKIRHVVGVANSESITTAARTLAISQPALTRSIAEVEKQLGVQLFVRLRRGMRLTEAGQVFVEHARRVIKSVDDLFVNTEDYVNLKLGRLKIGVAPAAYQGYLNVPLSRLVSDYPGMQLEIVTGSAEQLAQRIVSGDLDLLWGAARPFTQWPELDIEVVMDLHYGFMVRQDHPITKLKQIDEVDLLRYPILLPATVEPVHIDIAGRYAPNGLSPMHPRYVTDDFELVKTIIAGSDAFSHVASISSTFAGRLRGFKVYEGLVDIPPQQLAFATSAGRSHSPALKAFVEVVEKTFIEQTDR